MEIKIRSNHEQPSENDEAIADLDGIDLMLVGVEENTELKKGITPGVKHLVESKKVSMLANGAKKAKIMKVALEGRMGHLVPASIVQTIPHAVVMLDTDLASLLENSSRCN